MNKLIKLNMRALLTGPVTGFILSKIPGVCTDFLIILRRIFEINPRKIFPPRHMHYTLEKRILDKLIKGIPIEYIVMDKVSGIPISNNYLIALVDENFEVERKFGYFTIYRNKRFPKLKYD